MRKLLFLLVLLMSVFIVVSCEKEIQDESKEVDIVQVQNKNANVVKEKYLIEGQGEGWSLDNCIIEIDNGGAIIRSGKLLINDTFHYIDMEIYQYNERTDKRTTIYLQSYSVCEGTSITKEFNRMKIEDELIDIRYPIEAQINIEYGTKEIKDTTTKLCIEHLNGQNCIGLSGTISAVK